MNHTEFTVRRTDWEAIALPLVLMLTGLILIGGDSLGILSLDRIQNMWPMAVILIGLTELMPLNDANRSRAAKQI
jgi:uncharacterized membrane protein